MAITNEVPGSQFAYVIIAGKRARQLMSGASPLLANPRSHKATRIAMEELGARQLEYQTPELPETEVEKESKRRKE